MSLGMVAVSFEAAGGSGGDEPGDSGARRGADRDYNHAGHFARGVESWFAVVLSIVLQGDSVRVGKDASRQRETQSVFGPIGCVFGRIPLKDHRATVPGAA